jgi:nucleotide-binding universal stress UspA family protein
MEKTGVCEMTEPIRKRILVGIDESERAYRVVEYLSRIASLREKQVVLFNVASEIPESYWDLGNQQVFHGKVADVRAWKAEKSKEFEEHLDRTRQVLLHAGFGREAVMAVRRMREVGFATDLIDEARKGYQAVAIGRRGMSKLADLVLGSMATKLVEKVDFAPLLLVGKSSSIDRVLIAFDNSKNAMRAVDFAAGMLGGSDCRIELLHVVRAEDREYAEMLRKEISEGIEKARASLEQSGFRPESLSSRIVSGEQSRAGAIIEEARREGYGTIVVGRRGLSEVSEFSLGRVSNKVVYLARGLAVWLVD